MNTFDLPSSGFRFSWSRRCSRTHLFLMKSCTSCSWQVASDGRLNPVHISWTDAPLVCVRGRPRRAPRTCCDTTPQWNPRASRDAWLERVSKPHSWIRRCCWSCVRTSTNLLRGRRSAPMIRPATHLSWKSNGDTSVLFFAILWRAYRNGAWFALFTANKTARAAPYGLFCSCAATHDKTWAVAKSGGFCNSGWYLHNQVVNQF